MIVIILRGKKTKASLTIFYTCYLLCAAAWRIQGPLHGSAQNQGLTLGKADYSHRTSNNLWPDRSRQKLLTMRSEQRKKEPRLHFLLCLFKEHHTT